MSVQASESLFSEDLEEAPSGGDVRPSGYLAFALGLLCIVALLGGAWYIVPVVAILVALFALRPVPAGLDSPAGRGWAAVGLAIALFFTTWAGTSQTLRRVSMTNDAERFARDWLAVLADGNEELAYELTQSRPARQIAGIDLQRFYQENPDAYEYLRRFLMDSATQKVIDAGDKPQWELQGSPVITRRYTMETIDIVMVDTTGTVTPPVRLTLQRTEDPDTGAAEWSVSGITSVEQESRPF